MENKNLYFVLIKVCLFVEEFAKMKEEVPPLVVEAHARNIEAASKDDEINPTVGLSVSGIADENGAL